MVNITIIFFEEETPPQDTERTSAELSQGGHRMAGSHGIEQNLVDAGKVEGCGEQHDEGGDPGDTQPPGSSSHGDSISRAIASSSSGTHQSSVPPSGSGAGDVARDEEIWHGNACPVVEEHPDRDVVM